MKHRELVKIGGLVGIVTLLVVESLVAGGGGGNIVVANRASGTISVVDAGSATLVDTVALPQEVGDIVPEPMYVVHTPARNRVWVGDRANDRVVAFNGNDFSVDGAVPAGNGVFHMWADGAGKQLWVVNDIDKTVTVIDPRRMEVVTTVPMPADLSAGSTKPHDVMVRPDGTSAYVSFLDTLDPGADAVVQFDTVTFLEINRQEGVGEDPHLSFNRKGGELYMPCQGSNAVFVLDASSLAIKDMIAVPGAHGAITSTNSKHFFTTNLPGGGADAVFSVNTRDDAVADTGDTGQSVPHNLALTPDGKRLFVTHSGGANNTVSVFDVDSKGGLSPAGEVTVGSNPFGLTHAP